MIGDRRSIRIEDVEHESEQGGTNRGGTHPFREQDDCASVRVLMCARYSSISRLLIRIELLECKT